MCEESIKVEKTPVKDLVKKMASARLFEDKKGNLPSIAEYAKVGAVAVEYGVDPFAGHIMLYKHNPYVTVNGLIHHAQHQPDFDAIMQIPLVGEARKEYCEGMGLTNEGTCVFECRVYKKGSDRHSNAFATASKKDMGSFLASEEKNVPAMAQTRATGRALRTAYGIGAPIAEEIELETVPPDIDINASFKKESDNGKN